MYENTEIYRKRDWVYYDIDSISIVFLDGSNNIRQQCDYYILRLGWLWSTNHGILEIIYCIDQPMGSIEPIKFVESNVLGLWQHLKERHYH